MQLIPLELMKSNRDSVREAREAYLIDRGQTLEPLDMKHDTFSVFSSSVFFFCIFLYFFVWYFSAFLFRVVTYLEFNAVRYPCYLSLCYYSITYPASGIYFSNFES